MIYTMCVTLTNFCKNVKIEIFLETRKRMVEKKRFSVRSTNYRVFFLCFCCALAAAANDAID